MQFKDNTKPSSSRALTDKPKVYVLVDDYGIMLNVYNNYMDAMERAIEEVTEDPDGTFIENFDYVIYIQGDKGLVTIFMEDVL